MVNVLIVDDNTLALKPIQLLLPRYLEEEGIPVDARLYGSAREAENHIGWTDVAVIDGELFDANGGGM